MINDEPKKEAPSAPPQLPKGGGSGKRPEGVPPQRFLLAWMAVLFFLGMTLWMVSGGGTAGGTRDISDGELEQLAAKGEIDKVSFIPDPSSGILHVSAVKKGSREKVRLTILGSDGTALTERLRVHGVHPSVEIKSVWTALMFQLLPVVLFIGLLYFVFMRQVRSSGMGAMNFGKSRAKMLNQDKKKITFANVAGIKEAKEEVQEIVEFLKEPKKFSRLGGRIPKGVLLMGPPGTGKTLMAKAIAGEADVPFFSISGSDFVEMFVGVGASRVRDMFEQGKKNAPCIIFIDEIDAVGRSRFTGIGGGHDEREQTLNALLVEMDGFETSEGVIIIAATNRSDVLDAALLRPGRFDRQIMIDLPTLDGREDILRMHAQKLKLGPTADLRRSARGTPGFSGADLANLLNEAALLAARQNKEGVDQTDLEEARDKVLWGRERRSRAMSEKERNITAWHEAGHALTQVLLEHTEPVHKVTIIPRGQALGATMSLPDHDVLNRTGNELLDQLVVLMGGRIAEKLHTGDVSTGARMDIRMASQIAHHMVCEYGMSEVIGPQAFGENQELIFLGREVSRSQSHSEATSEKIDAEISRLIREACDRADALLKAHRDKLQILVERLLEEETMDGREVADLAKLGRFLTREELAEREMQESRARAEKEAEALAQAQARAAAQAVIPAPATHAVAIDGEAPSPPPAPPV
jgi:cell division protease FtsH